MNAPDTAAQAADALPALMGRLGAQAKAASAAMARATAAQKSEVLRDLAGMLRAHAGPLGAANARDLERARAGGLSGPMLDRLKLDAKTLDHIGARIYFIRDDSAMRTDLFGFVSRFI